MVTTVDVDDLLARLEGPAGPPAAACAPYRRFAALVPQVTPDRLARCLAGVGVTVDDPLEVYGRCAEHVAVTVQPSLRRTVVAPLTAAAIEAPPASAASPAGLVIDAAIRDRLPLLDLAADIALAEPSGALCVHVDPMRAAHGLFMRTDAVTIVLLAADIDADTLARAWAHELAHALDPALGVVHPYGAERFAETLAELLLDADPASRHDADALIAAVTDRCAPLRPYWPPVDVAAVVTWATTERNSRCTKSTPSH